MSNQSSILFYEHGGEVRENVEYDFSVNTSPAGIAPKVKEALVNAVSEAQRYPDTKNDKLKKLIAKREETHPLNIVLGNGASELITAFFAAHRPKNVLLCAPGFYGYERAAKAIGAEISYYMLREEDEFEVKEDISDMLLSGMDAAVLINPGNPSGRLISPDILCKFTNKAARLGIKVLLDECFADFCEEKHSPLKEAYILKAFTKYQALAGVRIGYLICPDKKEADKVEAVLPEWNISVFAQKAAEAALFSEEYYGRAKDIVKDGRAYLSRELFSLGMKVFPSDANFILFKSDIGDLKKRMLKKGILIRDCGNFTGLCEGFYRISVKTPEENEVFIRILKEVLK
ncbi:MAG: aminotransferase class I/II-fold pyridoxal phosphate-dependent enzyme [Eubacterium sp.]|nr:aminotransferase class I/II-fold pyridoxal phosphate-dependent enzyme [Eubacterium sp.]